jgi:hypothetical protein
MYGQGIRVTGGWIFHHHGPPWYDLPKPARWHRCEAATSARLGVVVPERFERCACGGWRVLHFGTDDFTEWRDRNSRRNGTAHNLTIL